MLLQGVLKALLLKKIVRILNLNNLGQRSGAIQAVCLFVIRGGKQTQKIPNKEPSADVSHLFLPLSDTGSSWKSNAKHFVQGSKYLPTKVSEYRKKTCKQKSDMNLLSLRLPQSCHSAVLPLPPPLPPHVRLSSYSYRSLRFYSSHCSSSSHPWPGPAGASGT